MLGIKPPTGRKRQPVDVDAHLEYFAGVIDILRQAGEAREYARLELLGLFAEAYVECRRRSGAGMLNRNLLALEEDMILESGTNRTDFLVGFAMALERELGAVKRAAAHLKYGG